jgi:hypothetical protein
MSDSLPASPFNCPSCNSSYQLVKVEAPRVHSEPQLTCLGCGAPLDARDGKYVLKYFFTDRYGKHVLWSGVRLQF